MNSVLSLTNAASFLLPKAIGGEGSETGLSPWFIFGATTYMLGIVTETVAAVQRKQFKNDAKNQGKVYTGGLFGLAIHVNYGAYTVWRGGYSLACGGPAWGSLWLLSLVWILRVGGCQC